MTGSAILLGMDSIPLHDGDPRWVFPSLMDTDAVREALDEARRIVEDLATQVGGNAGWTGCGLEFERYPSGEGAPADSRCERT